MGKGPYAMLSFLPLDNVPARPGIRDPTFPRALADFGKVEAGEKEVPGWCRDLPLGS